MPQQNRKNIIEYMQKTVIEAKEYTLWNMYIHIKDPLPDNINMREIISVLQQSIPAHLIYGIDTIYVGQFEDLIERGVNALYENGAIYVTNDQANNDDFINDVVHEIAHSVEEMSNLEIYADDKLELEFLKKRIRAYEILKAHDYEVERDAFMNVEYTDEYDDLLYREIGYPVLEQLLTGLFISPYALTSLREYFANGFENYYLNMNLSEQEFFRISPELFRKIKYLHNFEE